MGREGTWRLGFGVGVGRSHQLETIQGWVQSPSAVWEGLGVLGKDLGWKVDEAGGQGAGAAGIQQWDGG